MSRRLPIYVLADCSGSMSGHPIEQVKQGISMLRDNLLGDPQANESAYLSVITFSSTAQQLSPLTEVLSFQPPDLQAGGTTALGAGLRVLGESINTEVRKNTAEAKGDWRPLVFLLTDGRPTDDWQPFATQLKTIKPSPNIIALACGDAADEAAQVLKQVTPTVLVMRDMSGDSFAQFFAFASQLSQQVSAKAGTDAAAGGIAITPPPGIIIINPD